MNNKNPIESVYVYLRNFKLWFLDVLDVDIYYEDGKEVNTELSENPNFTTVIADGTDADKGSKEYEMYENTVMGFKKEIARLIEKDGFGEVDPNVIDYEIAEYIEPKD